MASGLPRADRSSQDLFNLFLCLLDAANASRPSRKFYGTRDEKGIGRLRMRPGRVSLPEADLPMKPRVLIVDGHSVIFQWPDLTLQHAKRTAELPANRSSECLRVFKTILTGM